MTTGPLGLDQRLWEILACPCEQHAPVKPGDGDIVCTACDRHFEVRDGIPIMLLDPES
jgi:uncharacterized protein YbaR (Trm112 family)